MKKHVITCCAFIFFAAVALAQTPGIIVRPAGGGGPAVLDPNANGYTSQLTSGFGSSDITNSEILYKIVAPVIAEPTGDLLRGPSGNFSDIVRTFDGSGFYLFSDGTNLLCRLRIGGIVSGSKGYSILLDTDQKFGPSGPNADPNYQAATNGNNGNPGFEYEVVFETNFRIAIYNVDGTSTPVLVMPTYSLTTNSQVSVAATTDGSNPDFFYDFYVPYAAMGLNASSIIRATATTVMSPGPAIGGPKSDIYGLGVNNYMEDWNTMINQQPALAISQLTNAGTGIAAPCTAPPVLNGDINSSTVSVTGTWTNSTYSSFTSATIRLYNGAVEIGNTTLMSPGAWSIGVSNLPDGSLITAKAQAGTESACLSSNQVKVTNCTPATQTASPVVTCGEDRGFEGTRVSGASIKLYKLTGAGYILLADDISTTYRITYPTATTWFYDDVNDQSPNDACSGGARDIDDGAYVAIATLGAGCASAPTYACIENPGVTATPTINSLLIDGLNTITGTAVANSGVILFINGYFVQSVTATGGVFSFSLTDKLSIGQVVSITAVATGLCASPAVTGTVSCYVAAPVITANTSGRVTVGAQLTGTSSAAAGSTITVYNAATLAVINTTTVQSNGSWTLASPVIAASTTYLARVTGHACGMSAASNTVTAATGTSSARCGSVTTPASESVTSVSGSVTSSVAGTIVVLFADGDSIGTFTTANLAWAIPVNTNPYNTIYSGAELTISIRTGTNTAVTCPATSTVPCASPTAPLISPAATTITSGQSVTYTITSPQSGILYSIRDNADAADAGASGFGSGASMTLVSNTFSTPGVYNLRIKATSFSGSGCTSPTSAATVTVLGSLPLTLTTFNGMLENSIVKLNWETVFEQDIEKFEIERSTTGIDFRKIGEVTAVGNSSLRNNYFFNDADAVSKVLYYRIRIIDKSTNVPKYSKVIIIRIDKGITINQVSPNPFMDVINMSFHASGKAQLFITVKDLSGRIVRRVNYVTRQGLNNIPVSNLNGMSAGTYVIEIVSEGDRVFRELLIKR